MMVNSIINNWRRKTSDSTGNLGARLSCRPGCVRGDWRATEARLIAFLDSVPSPVIGARRQPARRRSQWRGPKSRSFPRVYKIAEDGFEPPVPRQRRHPSATANHLSEPRRPVFKLELKPRRGAMTLSLPANRCTGHVILGLDREPQPQRQTTAGRIWVCVVRASSLRCGIVRWRFRRARRSVFCLARGSGNSDHSPTVIENLRVTGQLLPSG